MYCEKGDLDHKLDEVAAKNQTSPRDYELLEEYIWRFIVCVARVLVMLESDNEEHAQPAEGDWEERPIIHFGKRALRRETCGKEATTTIPVFRYKARED